MIIDSFKPELKLLLSEIESIGFKLCLVGGYPRDYFYKEIVGHDLDFEIRPRVLIEKNKWPIFYKKLLTFLKSKKLRYKELPYLITSVDFGEMKLEFSSPRIEITKINDFSHHHFTAELDPNLSYKESFKRRDFTINAIGVELNLNSNSEMIIDPYDGLKDLKNGALKNISDEFFFDSVRFLRFIRFHLKFKSFIVDKSLLTNLKLFNLKELSAYHFKTELFKSDPGKFLNLFKDLVLKNNMPISESFNVWTKFNFPESLKTKEEILVFVFRQNEIDAKKVIDFFSMPEKKLRSLNSFYQSYTHIKNLDLDSLKKLITLPLENILENSLLSDMKNLDEKKEWRDYFSADEKDLIISWRDWEDVAVDPGQIAGINKSLRSYYRYYKAVDGKIKNG